MKHPQNRCSVFKFKPLGAAVVAAMTMNAPSLAQNFPASIELSDLDGSNGFVVNGIGSNDDLGRSVSGAGDINGDGVDDLIISADLADSIDAPDFRTRPGEAYVIFGRSGLGENGEFNVSALDGSNGFLINGINFIDRLGSSVSDAGDINGDGVDDVIVGARGANPNGNGSGAAYVVYGGGGAGNNGLVQLADLDGTDGFALNGVSLDDSAGISVSAAGDINGDGVDDLIVGADRADPNGSGSGAAYVVFGGGEVGLGGVIELSELDGSNGFVINGIESASRAGGSVSAAGDINNDGVDDLIMDGDAFHVVFGSSGVGAGGVIELSDLDGSNGFQFTGSSSGVFTVPGARLARRAGDINEDGVDDVIIGDPGDDTNGEGTGASYVVFGVDGIGRDGVFDLQQLDGNNGFALLGIAETDGAGTSVSGAGDINGDDVDDMIIGASPASPNGNRSGQSYVVFGGRGVGSGGVIQLSDLDGSNGFALNGIRAQDVAGQSVSGAGDINDDGVDDLVIGAINASNPNIGATTGQSYVVFGKATTSSPVPTLTCNGLPVTVNLALGQTPTGDDDVILGTEGDDRILALAGNDTICSLGGQDFINAGSGDDWVDAGAGSDTVFGGDGADILRGRSGTDRIFGGMGDDLINGDGGSDFMRGARGDDILFGGGGQDGIFGNSGDDILFGGPGDDSLSGGAGVDRLNGSDGADRVDGGTSNDNCIVDDADLVISCE